MELIKLPDGRQVGTGLIVQEKKPVTCMNYEAAGKPMLTRQQVIDWIQNPRRTPRRKRFGKAIIKNQNGINACNGYMAALLLEVARLLQGMPWVKLSGDQIYSAINDGMDQGSALDRGMRWAMQNGISPEELVPKHEWRKNRIPKEAWDAAPQYRADEYFSVDNEDQLYSGMASGYLLGYAIHVPRGGLPLDDKFWCRPTGGSGNHAVAGLDLTILNGKIGIPTANSWDIAFGDEGWFVGTWDGHIKHTIRYHETYLCPGGTWKQEDIAA